MPVATGSHDELVQFELMIIVFLVQFELMSIVFLVISCGSCGCSSIHPGWNG
jgi:hypothetical protein